MSRLILACILIAGCADVGGGTLGDSLDGPQRTAGEAALADPFGYGPDIEAIAAEHAAQQEADAEPLTGKDPADETLADQWRRFLNP
ncbi:MAG: hypothetical protein AAF743_10795 [Planctomycetota bacterium]